MNRTAGCLATVLLMSVAVGGCQKAKSPDAVAKDVNSAAQTADSKSAKAEEKAEQQIASAQGDVAKTEAEGRRKIDLAKCEALSGDQQQACKDRANASYDMAVAQAKQASASADSKQR